MNTQKTILALAIAAVAAIPAYALTDGPYTGAFATDGTTYTSLNFPGGTTISVTGFNTTGGKVLSQVDVTLRGFGQSTHVINQNTSGQVLPAGAVQSSYTITLTAPGGGGQTVIATPVLNSNFGTTAINGTQSNGPINQSNTQLGTFTTGLGVYQGASVIFDLTALSFNGTTIGGAPNISWFNAAKADVSVTYTYSIPETQVPEPRVYGAIGAVACLGLLGYRRLRARQAAQA